MRRTIRSEIAASIGAQPVASVMRGEGPVFSPFPGRMPQAMVGRPAPAMTDKGQRLKPNDSSMSRWTVRSVGLVLTAMLAACAVPGQYPASAPLAPLPPAATPVFATQLAGPSTFLAPMPTAVVILKPGDLNRNRAFCTAMTTRLPTAQQALATSVIAPNLVLTRWLIQLPEVPADRASDCDFLVGTYDYARAARLLNALRLTDGRISGPGPFLLMVIPDSSGLHVAGLDGSGYNQVNFGRFVDTWGAALSQTQAQVTHNPDQPGLVRSIFNLISAILRTATGMAGGLIQGAVNGL